MDPSAEKVKNRRRIKNLGLLVLLIAISAAAVGAYWFLVLRYRETTDDAYVMADSARISSRVPGTLARVMVENDRPVETGQALVELDPRDYQAAVGQAEGVVARVEAEIAATEVSTSLTDTQTAARLQESEAKLQQALDEKREGLHKLDELKKRRVSTNADLNQARLDFKRFDSLFETGAVSQEQRDKFRTALVKAKAQVEATDAELDAVRASLQASDQEVEQAQAQLRAAHGDRRQIEVSQHRVLALRGELKEAQAMLQAAELDLSYCIISAPISGYIAQKSIQVGDRVQPGQSLMAVVPLQDAYVEANFKETQLEHIRLGQPATIEADVYPDYIYRGRVVGIRAGTGASFSLLPPENATGNWIKVVQRVPVKISLDEPPPPDYPLRLGFSLQITVSTRDRSGRMLVPLAPKP